MNKVRSILNRKNKKTLVISGWLAFLIISIIFAATGQSWEGLETFARILSIFLGLF